MNQNTRTGNPSQWKTRQGHGLCSDLPPCPACGGLTCFCRPRFFAGQILTEADLNRLEQYVVEKNRLHNRYLHGAGVVCGLAVECDPCGNGVTVRSGYAISPCGDDIIVCEDDTAPVCDLIRKCRPVTNDPDCNPFVSGNRNANDDQCRDLVEDWVLAICYNETAARGVVPMRGGASAKSRCSCGGSSSSGCDCGCGGVSKAAAAKANRNGCGPAPRTAPAPCEPTLTCEGYTFTVYKAPRDEKNRTKFASLLALTPTIPGRLAESVLQCVSDLVETMPPYPAAQNEEQPGRGALRQWVLLTKQWFHDLLRLRPSSDCELSNLLNSLSVPNPDSDNFDSDFSRAKDQIRLLKAEYLKECLCRALLPPCPPPADCNCVPLSLLKVRRGDCKVLQVCNWGAREFVLTFPDLVYWLEGTGVFQHLTLLIERFCCTPISSFMTRGQDRGNLVMTPPPASSTAGSAASPFFELFKEAWSQRNDRSADAGTLADAYSGTLGRDSKPAVSPLEMANPAAFMALNQILVPLLESFTSRGSTTAGSAASAVTPASDELAALRKAVDDLQASVKAQADEIARLKKT